MEFIRWISFIIAIIATSQANALQSSNQDTLKIIYVCDLVTTKPSISCNNYNALALTNLAEPLLEPPISAECEQNPNNLTCDLATKSGGQNEIHFFVVDVDDEQAKYFVAKKSSSGSVILVETAISSTNLSIAYDIYSLESELVLAATKYSFNQNEDGSFTNFLNQTVTSLTEETSIFNNRVLTSPDSCQSAIAYNLVQGCAGLINWMIRTQNNKAGSAMANIYEITRNVHFAVDAGGFQFATTVSGAFELAAYFKDGSLLVVEVTPGANVAIKVMGDKSFTRGGLTFAQYATRAHSFGIIDGFKYSGGEARSIFMGWPQCTNLAYTISHAGEYLVTIEKREDGLRVLTSVQLIGSAPHWDTKTVCQLNKYETRS